MTIKRRDLLLSGGAFVGGALIGVAAPANAHEYELGKLTIEHPWVRAPKDGETTAYFYAFIHNKGDGDRLIAVKSPNVGSIEFHASAGHDVSPNGVEIVAKKTTTLSPEGAHVVLRDIKKINPVGWGIELTLVFEKAGEVDIDAAVDAPDAKHAHDAEAMARWEKAHAKDGAAPAAAPAGDHDHHHHDHDHKDK
jgi:periplasmic copper chaperone A